MEGMLTVKYEEKEPDDLDVLTSCPNCNNMESLNELFDALSIKDE